MSSSDSNGATPAFRELSDSEMIEALEIGHTFPGDFPIVVIAKHGDDFPKLLEQTVSQAQGDAAYSITERPSSEGRYVSYRVEVHVDSAHAALERKRLISGLDGVILLL